MENEILDVLQTNGSGGFSSGSGDVAARLLASGFNVNALRTNALLRWYEWLEYDQVIVDVAREQLIGVADLLNAGLRFDIPNGLGHTQIQWEKQSDMDAADMNMSGVTEGSRDRVTYDLDILPLPIIHKDFQLNIRILEASRNRGIPLDTTQATVATIKVAQKVEDLLFNGGYVAGSKGTIYGYLTAPLRNTGSVSATWLTATGTQVVTDVLAMIGKAVGDNMYGPYMLYVPFDVYVALGNDFKANSDLTILQRIKEIPGILDVRPSKRFAAPNVVLVQFTRDVVDMVVGLQPTPLEWQTMGGMVSNFKVMTIMVPRIKSDANSQSGIVHYS